MSTDKHTYRCPRWAHRMVGWLDRSHDGAIGRIGFHYEPRYNRARNYLLAGIEKIGGSDSNEPRWWQARIGRVCVSLYLPSSPNIGGVGSGPHKTE